MCVYATPSSREASIKCCRARRVAARVAHKILWQPKRGTTTTFRIQQHLQMSRCALYPCICEIRRYTDSEHYATFTFCSSTVSVAIYATHKKTGRERGGEGQREEKRGGEQRIHPSLRFSAGCRLSFSLVGELGALHLHSILVKSVAHSMLAPCRAGWGRGKGRARCLSLWCFSKCLSLVSWPWLSNPANECGFYLPLSAFPFGFGFSHRYWDKFKVLNGKRIFQIEFSSNSISFKKIFLEMPNSF